MNLLFFQHGRRQKNSFPWEKDETLQNKSRSAEEQNHHNIPHKSDIPVSGEYILHSFIQIHIYRMRLKHSTLKMISCIDEGCTMSHIPELFLDEHLLCSTGKNNKKMNEKFLKSDGLRSFWVDLDSIIEQLRRWNKNILFWQTCHRFGRYTAKS